MTAVWIGGALLVGVGLGIFLFGKYIMDSFRKNYRG